MSDISTSEYMEEKYDSLGFRRPDVLITEPLAELAQHNSLLRVLDGLVVVCEQLTRTSGADEEAFHLLATDLAVVSLRAKRRERRKRDDELREDELDDA